MELREFLTILEEDPVVAAVKSEEELERCLQSSCGIVFILYGSILTIGAIVDRVKAAGKVAMVHLDLLEGLSAQNVAVDFIAQNTRADGILSIKPGLIQRAKAKGLITIQRFFLLDSIALKNIPHQLSQNGADLVEVLPGAMPKAIAQLAASIQKPIIAGGMIRDKEDVTRALSAGAVGISASSETIWGL